MAHEYLFSRNAVYEALQAGRRHFHQILIADGAQEKGRLADILQVARQKSIRVDRVPKVRLNKVNLAHQGVIAETDDYQYIDLLDILEVAHNRAEQPFILILDSLQDPQNFGTLLRTAEALGVHGVVIPLAHTVAVTPVVVNASSGASEYLAIARSNIAQVWMR